MRIYDDSLLIIKYCQKTIKFISFVFYQLCFTDTLTRDNECHEEK